MPEDFRNAGPNFPVFGVNMEIYSVNLHIHSECKKYGPEKLQIPTLFMQRLSYRLNQF